MIENVKSFITLNKLKKNAITEYELTEDGSKNIFKVKSPPFLYITSPKFYEKSIKGNEKYILKILKEDFSERNALDSHSFPKSIAVLYEARDEDKICFLYNAGVTNKKKKLDKNGNILCMSDLIQLISFEGIRSTEEEFFPLGKGIYVWPEDKFLGVTNIFKIQNYEGKYLKLVSLDGDARSTLNTEFLLLKTLQKGAIQLNY